MTLKTASELRAITAKAEKERKLDEATCEMIGKILRVHDEQMMAAAQEGHHCIESSICSRSLLNMSLEEAYAILAPLWVQRGFIVKRISDRKWRISW